VKAVNTINKNKEAAPAAPSKQEELLTEIRDLLKNK
jgi:large conductance mechanosensitive channel